MTDKNLIFYESFNCRIHGTEFSTRGLFCQFLFNEHQFNGFSNIKTIVLMTGIKDVLKPKINLP